MGGGKNAAPTPAPPPTFDFGAMMAAMQPMHMPSVSQPTGPSLEEQREQQRMEQGIADRDAAYTDYMDAASSATDYINREIDKERANARLMGIEYDVTDEQKSQRINDYFATVWGEGQQTKMEQLFDEFGKPKGFEDFTVTRGDASKYEKEGGASEEVVGSTGKPKKVASPLLDDETLGGQASPLG